MKRYLIPGIILFVCAALATAQAGKGGNYPEPKLLNTGLGVAADLTPTDKEIAAARQRLEKENSFIGIIAITYSTEYHATVAESAENAAKKLGLPVRTFDSDLKVDKQINAIESFTASGASAVIIGLFDPPSVRSALADAAKKGVMIVQYAGRDVVDLGGVSISIEDADLGYAAGEYAGKLIAKEMAGKARVAILDYPDLPNVVVRAQNIAKALMKEAPGAQIVGNYLGGTPENGLKSMESALQAHPDINVVASINDAGAFGALKALQNAGRTADNTIIVGIDAEKQALEYIRNGTMYRGTIDTAPATTGALAVNAVVKLLAGGTLPQRVRVPVNLITRENVGK
ncbi:MAG: sugar ABC transporter substrate-binding protein [Spirochaetia bacterium]|jgi:ribose transport system substrate-binding protein